MRVCARIPLVDGLLLTLLHHPTMLAHILAHHLQQPFQELVRVTLVSNRRTPSQYQGPHTVFLGSAYTAKSNEKDQDPGTKCAGKMVVCI